MLFKMNENGLEAFEFLSLGQLGMLEKDLENILSDNMFVKLFEGDPQFVIFQERALKPEPDIIALDYFGNLVVYELKRLLAEENAIAQLFGYVQKVQSWDYQKLQQKTSIYLNESNLNLKEKHKEWFGLDNTLEESQFNKKQKMIIVGNSADTKLIQGIDYWRHNGIDIDFIPYRVFKINEQYYFDFFAKPYDIHSNPAETKGVLFDTNESWDPDAIWDMFQSDKVSAYGDAKRFINYLSKNDYVFLSKKYYGIVAACRVKSKTKMNEDNIEYYVDVEYLTKKPNKATGIESNKFLKFSEVSEITGKKFFHARTLKVPYLDKNEAEKLLEKLRERIG